MIQSQRVYTETALVSAADFLLRDDCLYSQSLHILFVRFAMTTYPKLELTAVNSPV